jgi:SpoVK/Ycf46/Vps4 family AAA+-type ATPase
LRDENRVVFIGCTNRYDLNPKLIKKVFQKTIYFPYPDYGTRMALVKKFVEQKGGSISESLSLSSLAQLTEGFTAGAVNFILYSDYSLKLLLTKY